MKASKIFTRVLALLLSITLSIFGFTVVTTAVTDVNGEEMPASAIAISNVDELAMIGYEYPADGYYYLANDIDMTAATTKNGDYYNEGLGWEPIGNENSPFTGTFNGNGKKLIGLNIARVSNNTSNYVGLFGYVSGATIKNLTIEKASISGYYYVSAIAGYAVDGMFINNTVTECSITGTLHVGGVVGYAKTTITIGDCSNVLGDIEISADARVSQQFVGGIVGYVYDGENIYNCLNSSSVGYNRDVDLGEKMYSSFYIGGICGYARSALTIENCSNHGTLSSVINSDDSGWYYYYGTTLDTIMGGIIGEGSATTIKKCSNLGMLVGESACEYTQFYSYSNVYLGGIAQYASQLEQCYNLGKIKDIGARSAYFNGGAILGIDASRGDDTGKNVYIKNCFNAAKIACETILAENLDY